MFRAGLAALTKLYADRYAAGYTTGQNLRVDGGITRSV